MAYDDVMKEIHFTDLTMSNVGEFTVTVTLQDPYGAETSYDILFKLTFKEEEKQTSQSGSIAFNVNGVSINNNKAHSQAGKIQVQKPGEEEVI
jgi:hypothetical protein